MGESEEAQVKVADSNITNEYALIRGIFGDINFTKDVNIKYNYEGSLIWLWLLLLLLLLIAIIWLIFALTKGGKKKKGRSNRVSKYKKNKKRSFKWIWILLLILFIILLACVWIFGCTDDIIARQNSTETLAFNDILEDIDEDDNYKVMNLNSRWSFNLLNIFNDPDGDELNYTYEQDNNITIWTSGNRAYVLPDESFTGKRTIKFTAEDPFGESVDSTDIDVYVRPYEAWYKVCWKEILASIVLIALIILCIFKIAKPRGK